MLLKTEGQQYETLKHNTYFTKNSRNTPFNS
jgi:hypothetical protein